MSSIKIEQIKTLEAAERMKFAAYSTKESEDKIFCLKQLATISKVMYKAEINGVPIMILGIAQPGLIGQPDELWILSSKELERNPLIMRFFFHHAAAFFYYHPRLITRIDKTFTGAHRMARFFGFKRAICPDDKYVTYEIGL